LLPNANNGNLLMWSQRMVTEGICPRVVPKILAFLQHKDKLNKFKIELITVVCVGKHLKAWGTDLEGQTFEFITAYETLVSMGQELKSCMSSEVLGNLLAAVVEENGGKNDLSVWGHVMQGKVSHVAEILLSLVSVNRVIVSINPHWWDWSGEVPPTRVRGRITRSSRLVKDLRRYGQVSA
jgi:hypothetical protein